MKIVTNNLALKIRSDLEFFIVMQEFLHPFLFPDNDFKGFTLEHLLPIVLFALGTFGIIRYAKTQNVEKQNTIGLYYALFVLITLVLGIIILVLSNQFSWKKDLPIFICHLLAFTMPLTMKNRSEYWFGVFYFWIFAGTAQGLITPDIKGGWPYFLYIRYWTLHCGLVGLAAYGLSVYKIKITKKHLLHSIFWMLLFLVFSLSFNAIFSTNYSYVMEKPPVVTTLSFLGDWPIYVLQGFGLAVVLFLILFGFAYAFQTRLKSS